jgi:hypothetical protein
MVVKSCEPILWNSKFNVESATFLKKTADYEKKQRGVINNILEFPEMPSMNNDSSNGGEGPLTEKMDGRKRFMFPQNDV